MRHLLGDVESPKLTHHLNIRVEDDLAEQLVQAAREEDMPLSVFCRKLLRWAIREYKKQNEPRLYYLAASIARKRQA